MKDAFHIVRSALENLWDDAFMVIFCSLVWLFLTMLIIPGPPATVALFDISERIAKRDRLLEFRDYLRAVWRNFGAGWRWAAINIPVLLIVAVDIRVVPQMVSTSLAVPIQMAFYFALALWLIVNWYALAFLFQQEKPSVRQALRNGGVLLLRHPWFSFMLALFTAILLALSFVFVIVNMLFGPMLVGLIATHAVADRLEIFRFAKRA
jgi:hypothetical protein